MHTDEGLSPMAKVELALAELTRETREIGQATAANTEAIRALGERLESGFDGTRSIIRDLLKIVVLISVISQLSMFALVGGSVYLSSSGVEIQGAQTADAP